MKLTQATLAVVAVPILRCLVAGGLKALYDYQASPHWTPALVDGGITALSVAAAQLTILGGAAGLQQIGAVRTAAAAPPAAG